ncbi:hypothetical protein [Streptomyces sp. NPDC007063]|uniref:hypothetical protein n=1 Tax=Streptomyces sp. NPDC007063 TaxID=3364772 RepID=UPI0036A21FDB
MTDALDTAIEDALAKAGATEDTAERAHATAKLREKLSKADRRALALHQSAVRALYDEDPNRTWADVGAVIGKSGSRAEAIARGRYTRADHASQSTRDDSPQ